MAWKVCTLIASAVASDHVLGTASFSSLASEDVRSASRVTGDLGALRESYSGFFSTDNATKHEFWWYFPAPADAPKAPLILWLQGGPGASSLGGLFTEMGPFEVRKPGEVTLRPVAWTDRYAMLFIDNPVGAGFSYTTGSYCDDTRDCVSRNLYELLQQFYAAFPELLDQDFYITGESYAGHYVPGLSAYITDRNTEVKAAGGGAATIPFTGMAIGDGWVDPINQLPAYAEMVFGMGLVSFAEKAVVQDYADRSGAALKAGDFRKSFDIWDEMINGDVFAYNNYFHNVTGSNNYYNYMISTGGERSYHYQYLDLPEVRQAIHAGDVPYGVNGGECEMHLLEDFMVSFRPEVEQILEAEKKVMIYSGQLDVIIGAALTENSLPFLEWPGAKDFAASHKSVWRVERSDDEVAGFVNQAGGLIYAMVRGAGHMVPGDQPQRALDLITRFIEGQEFEHLPEPIKPLAEVSV